MGCISLLPSTKSGRGGKNDNLQLECPEGKLRNPSRIMTTSVFVHMASVDKPKIGSVALCGGRQRAIMSVCLNIFSRYRVEKGKARMGVRGEGGERREGKGGRVKEGKGGK